MNPFLVILQRRDMLLNLTKRELMIRYRGSVLGFLWTLLIPLFMALIYVGFLRLLAGRGVPLSEIIIGVFAWTYTVQCVNSGLNSITGNVNLVKKVALPRFILPLASTTANTVNYLLSLIVQFPLIYFLERSSGGGFSAWWWAFPIVLAVQFCFNLAISLFLSSSNVYFRDTEHLVNVGLSAMFFMSPVMYNLQFIENMTVKYPWFLDAYILNPVAVIMTGYRAIILEASTFPMITSALIAVLACPVLLIIAYYSFQRSQRNFADFL